LRRGVANFLLDCAGVVIDAGSKEETREAL
jgi:hypothetical protein